MPGGSGPARHGWTRVAVDQERVDQESYTVQSLLLVTMWKTIFGHL